MKWINNIKLSQKLNFALGCFFILMVVMGIFSLRQLENINQKVVEIHTNWMPSAYSASEMKNAFNDFRVAMMQHLFALDSNDNAEIAYTSEQMRRLLETYRHHEAVSASLIVNDQERGLYQRSRQFFESYLTQQQELVELYKQNKKADALALMKGTMRDAKNEYTKTLDALSEFQFQGGRQTALAGAELVETSRQQTYLILALMGLFELLVGVYVVRVFSHSVVLLQRAGVHTCGSANQLAAVIQQQEATIGEQAASSNAIVASSKEISATAKVLNSNMDDIVQVADDTSRRASEGQQSLVQLDETMSRLVEASNAITSKLAILNEKAGNINAVVNLIVKIADQTNLLSLNAAIEAEKAGEYGLGFSVVATEIRRLSDQTSVATFDIEQILKEMQSSVSASVMGMDKFAEEIRRTVDEVRNVSQQLTEITEQTKALSPRFEVIYDGMQAQNQGTEQITESMSQFNEGLHQTAQSIRNSRETVTLLTEASQDLQRVVKALG